MSDERVAFPWRSPQTAEMEAELKRGPLADINTPLMSDQEIRARALECAMKFVCAAPAEDRAKVCAADIFSVAADFEAYIKDGKT